ncbi:hypothetical protein [uncultured Ferrimonas sp.]|uniref:hypothetical protein n=1 Tax=uncultured Ferrimonas sp. TaxID=432640 RepID=UPI0026119E8C|nr:hypothetical protein [uncultured Ferrimonas sp.]
MMKSVGNTAEKLNLQQQQAQQRQSLLDDYQLEPEQLISEIEQTADTTTLLVDFDETLWLRNSTETFLANVKPALMLAIIIQLLGMLRPWKWFGGEDPEHYREVFRLKVVLWLMPWAKQQWLATAKELGPKYLNQPLYAALQQRDPKHIHIVSFGFDFIVAPMLAAIDPKLQLTMCSRLDNASTIRAQGKARTVEDALGVEVVAASTTITDSLLDRDLLQRSAKGLLCKWPNAKCEHAGLSPMLPLVFTKKVNRPKENYITRVILGHDYLGLLLAFALVSPEPLLCAASLLLFVLAYFSIYETGYHENDRLGLILEEKPQVATEFLQLGHHFKPWFAWSCGLLIAVPAAWIASLGASWLPAALSLSGLAAVAAIWAGFALFMLAVRAVFYWFNRTPVRGRLLPMLLLQFARNCGYILFFPTIESGALFCLAWTLGKWFPYVIYRFNGTTIGYPNHLVTALLLLSMMTMVGFSASAGFTIYANWPTALIVIYVLARGGKDLFSFRNELTLLKPIKRDGQRP